MELKKVDSEIYEKDIFDVKFTEISLAKICYLGYNRNAWHSTWIKRYWENGSFHLSLETAKSFAEKNRIQGSKFVIQEIPAIVFSSKKCTLFFVSIDHNLSFLKFSDLVSIKVANKSKKVDLIPQIIKGQNLKSVIDFFPKNSANYGSCFFCENLNSNLILPLNTDSFNLYSSESIWGSGYCLAWNKKTLENKFDLSVFKNFIDTTTKISKSSDKVYLHWVFNENITPENGRNKDKFNDMQDFLKSNIFPMGNEILISSNFNESLFFDDLKKSFRIKKNKNNFKLAKKNWWKFDDIRIDFPSYFFYELIKENNEIMKKNISVLINFFTSFNEQYSQTKKSVILSFNNGSLKVIYIKVDIASVIRKRYYSPSSKTIELVVNGLVENIFKTMYSKKDKTYFYTMDEYFFFKLKGEIKTINLFSKSEN